MTSVTLTCGHVVPLPQKGTEPHCYRSERELAEAKRLLAEAVRVMTWLRRASTGDPNMTADDFDGAVIDTDAAVAAARAFLSPGESK